MTGIRLRTAACCVAAALGLVFLPGCSRTTSGDNSGQGVPEQVASAQMAKKGVICPLETINGLSTRKVPPLSHGSDANFVGWSTVADHDNPAPPLVHIVLRPQVVGVADTFISGSRTKRPDIANGNSKLQAAGFQARGLLPQQPGNYNVFVWVGDQSKQIECDTGIAIEVR